MYHFDLGWNTYGEELAKTLPETRCDKCNKAIELSFKPVLREGSSPEQQWPRVNEAYNKSTQWTRLELQGNTERCPFCRFLFTVFESDPRLDFGRDKLDSDILILRPEYVGSILDRIPREQGEFDIEYWRCYRPRIQCCEKEKTLQEFGREYKRYSSVTGYVGVYPLVPAEKFLSKSSAPAVLCGRNTELHFNATLALKWLETCHKNHVQSNPDSTQVDFLGSCAVAPWPCDFRRNLRLIDVISRCVVRPSTEESYVALSYAWGNAKRLLLDTNTVSRLSAPGGLSDDQKDVPNLFLDVMNVCQKLHRRYLWIDALCIMQDEVDELTWHLENMHNIYSSADMTVVSTMPSADYTLPGVGSRKFLKANAVYQANDLGLLTVTPSYGEALQASVWETRGWTLQEKVFSHRLLVFTFDQVYFHCPKDTCKEDIILECLDENNRNLVIESDEQFDRAFKRYISIDPEALTPQRETWARRRLSYFSLSGWGQNTYKSLISAYIPRQLSNEMDILNAVRGMLNHYEGDYYGLPSSTFPENIGWSLYSNTIIKRRALFPSWSWAGWRGELGTSIHFVDMSPLNDPDYYIRANNKRTRPMNEITRNVDVEYFRYTSGAWRSTSSSKVEHNGLNAQKTDQKNIYGIDSHPGGSRFQASKVTLITPSDACFASNELLRIEHIICFSTSSAMLLICPPESHRSNNCKVRNPATEEHVGYIKIDPAWRDPCYGLAEFVVIGPVLQGQTPGNRESTIKRSLCVQLMLIQRNGNIVYRVELLSRTTSLSSWRATNPVWKTFFMA